MATKINQVDVMAALNNLMGRRVLPGGTQDDLVRYAQAAFDYAWRYYKWTFSLKTASIVDDGSGNVYMPVDFDIEGYRKFIGATEATLDEVTTSTGSTVAIIWDYTANRYKVTPATPVTVVYQIEPPTLTDSSYVPFPSAMVVAIGATIFAKQGENPTRADISQEWDEFHSELDRLVARAEANRPRQKARNYHDKMGTFTGDVG